MTDHKKEGKLNTEFVSNNLSPNETVITCGRCTSTPNCLNPISPNHFDSNIDSIEEKTNIDLSSLNEIINCAPVPIFGRRNLKLLNKCVRQFKNLSNGAKESLIKNEVNTNETLTKSIFKNKFWNLKGKILQQSFKNNSTRIKLEIKNAENKKFKNSNKLMRVSGVKTGVRRSNEFIIKKRRSTHNDSKPTLQINTKRPKSPKLLTAIRAQLKQNREIKNDNNSNIEHVFKANPIRKYKPLPELKKRNITIPHSPKLGKRRHINSYH